MNLDDLEHFVTFTGTSTAADGRVAFGTKRMNVGDDRYDAVIWLADESGIRQMTVGTTDIDPSFSPDGNYLAFLRKGPDKTDLPQLAVIDVAGGEARVLTDFSMGARSFSWSPDNSQLVVSAVEYAAEWADADQEERARMPVRLTRLPMRVDTAGPLHNNVGSSWLVPIDGSEPTKLSADSFREVGAVYSPDGASVAFLSDRSGRLVSDFAQEIWLRDLASGELTKIADAGMWGDLTYDDSGRLHAVGLQDVFDWPDMMGLWRFDDTGPTNLTGALDRGVQSVVFDGNEAIFTIEDAGRVTIHRLAGDGSIETVHHADSVVSAVSVGGGSISFVESTFDHPGEVMARDVHGITTISDMNADLRERLVDGHHIEIDGVDAWVFLPPGSATVPLLLNIHGGPAAQYGYGFFDEFQVYVGAGYGVVCCNPRGSSGKGRDHIRGVVGDGWGVNDLADIQSALDAALAQFPRLDASRMGVMGGSYGGFMTAWLTARDQRFASSVVERGLLNWVSFAGTSDIGAYFSDMYLAANLPADASRLWEASPMALAHQITTPTLVVHSENDFRCPIEQAEQLFMTLLRSGVDSEMVRFPGESHELSRAGKPLHRRERFEAILDWHGRYLLAVDQNLAN